MRKGKATSSRRSGKRELSLGPPADQALMQELVTEMSRFLNDLLRQMGVSQRAQARGTQLARKNSSRRRPAAAVMATLTGVGDVLSMWRREKRYTGIDGAPRVLPIRGRGASLETLARRCAPKVPLGDLLKTICRQGEVIVYKDNKVALLGSSTIMTQSTPEMTLAWLITQYRHMAETALYNAMLPTTHRSEGLLQRQVTGWLSEKEFTRFAQQIRPNFHEFCVQLENRLAPSGRRRGNRQECGVGLFLYRDPRHLR
jgi:hypothetical protein